jgi:hypothetical protein
MTRKRLTERLASLEVQTNLDGEIAEAWDARPRPRWHHHVDNPVTLLDTALAAAGCIAVTLLVAVLVLI